MQFCYQSKNMKSFLIALVFFSGICVNESGTTSVRQRENGDQCPLSIILFITVMETVNVEQDSVE